MSDERNEPNIYRITLKGDLKFEYLYGENDERYQNIIDGFWINEIEFSKGEGGEIIHSFSQDDSSAKHEGKLQCLVLSMC